MKLWLFLLVFVSSIVYAKTAIVYDESISRFIDRDVGNVVKHTGPITTIYYSNRVWNVSELNLVGQQTSDEVLLRKYQKVVRVSEGGFGVHYFGKYTLQPLVKFLDQIGYGVPYILILVDDKHSLNIVQRVKAEAAKQGIVVESFTVTTKYSLEKAVLEANINQRGVILNMALTAIEGETNVALTYDEISNIVRLRNKKHLVVGLNRSNPVCVCATKESIIGLLEGNDLTFGIMLNATALTNSGQTSILLDGIIYAEEINFE